MTSRFNVHFHSDNSADGPSSVSHWSSLVFIFLLKVAVMHCWGNQVSHFMWDCTACWDSVPHIETMCHVLIGSSFWNVKPLQDCFPKSFIHDCKESREDYHHRNGSIKLCTHWSVQVNPWASLQVSADQSPQRFRQNTIETTRKKKKCRFN